MDKGSHQHLILMHLAPTWHFSKCPLEVAVVHLLGARASFFLAAAWTDVTAWMWLAVRVVWMKTVGSSQLLLCVLCTFPHFSETSMLMSKDLTTHLFLSESSQPSPVPTDVLLLCNSLTAPRPRCHVWSLMPLTVKAVIIVIAAAKPIKYLSGFQEDVMSLIRQTVRSKVCQEGRRECVVWANDCMRCSLLDTCDERWLEFQHHAEPSGAVWDLMEGQDPEMSIFCCPEPNGAGGDTRGSEMLTDYF